MIEFAYCCLWEATVGYSRLQQITEWLQWITAGYRVVTEWVQWVTAGYRRLPQVTK